MAKTLTDAQQKKIKATIFARADAFGYMSCGRIESGQFMDELVEDPEIGGILKEYMPKERIRTYIKDGVLNAYTKQKNKQALAEENPENIIRRVFNYHAFVIQNAKGKHSGVTVLRAKNGKVFVVSNGTAIKWETALRKALEIIANEPGLVVEGQPPYICVHLSELSEVLTEADRNHIRTALSAIGVSVVFCGRL